MTSLQNPCRMRAGVALASISLLLTLAAAPRQAAAQAAAPATENGADIPQGGTFDGILRALDLKAHPSTASDFVRKSRPATTEFIPVGRPHSERAAKVLTPDEVEAETNSLDAARVAQQRRAGITPPPVPLKKPRSAAATANSRNR